MRQHAATSVILRRMLCIVLLVFTAAGYAEPVQAPHVVVDMVAKRQGIAPGSAARIGVYFKLEPGWHIYWKNAGDSGLPPKVKWQPVAGITPGPLMFPVPKRLPLGPLMDFGYEGQVLFPVDLQVGRSLIPGSNAKLAATVDWLVCRDMCLPGRANLVLDLSVTAGNPPENPQTSALFAKWESLQPQPLPAGARTAFESTATGFRLSVFTGHRETAAQFFPFESNIINNAAPQNIEPLKNGVALEIRKSDGLQSIPGTLRGVVVLGSGAAYELNAPRGLLAVDAAPHSGIGTILEISGLALLGGMILNLMPCVFPVLFIKGLSLVESVKEDAKRVRIHGLVYTAGILVSFWVIVAALIALRSSGRGVGWGFQFQSPVFVALMALFLFFLGLSLAGLFDIGLTMTSKGGKLAAQSGYAGSFFTGALAVVVATPCTAPMMGLAVGFALAQSALVTFAIFTALAIGLALPYLLLTFNPGWRHLLPRPGAWMEIVKQATSIPIFATVIWLVWVLAQLAGINELLSILTAMLLTAIAGWILGKWTGKKTAAGFATAVLVFAVALPVVAITKFGMSPAAGKTMAGIWQPFDPEHLAQYRAEGRPVFVDFTASWCLSCQVNERMVLSREDVRQKLLASKVVLMKADWTQRDEGIAQALNQLGRDGVPAYALYPATPGEKVKVLPEVLTRDIVYQALDEMQKHEQSAPGPRAALEPAPKLLRAW